MSLFTDVVVKVPKKRRFNRSYENYNTTDFGVLKPVVVEEIYPGDSYKASIEASIKLAPLVAPSMARIDVYYHWFFVPTRLLYSNWENFITGGTDGTSPNGTISNPVAPYIDINDMFNSSVNYLKHGMLPDDIGMPSNEIYTGSSYVGVPPISAFPFLAYHKIFSDWYRDELLDSYEFEPVPDGAVKTSFPLADLFSYRYRAWQKDYFTSARPDTQLGAQEQIPVSGNIVSDGFFRLGNNNPGTLSAQALYPSATSEDLGPDSDPRYARYIGYGQNGYATGSALSYIDGLSLDEAGILINDLRRSLKAQEWKEKNMRGGNRYIENILHHFGVQSSDARLQRSQYLGGQKMPVVIGEILQSVDQNEGQQTTSASAALGARGGVGSSGGRTKSVHLNSEEHGWLICMMSILPHATYQQGIPRYLANRYDRMEYMWPEFGNIGEQEVYNWELFVGTSSSANNDGVFGYQSRYADLKVRPGEVHGDFRTNALDFYTNARKFANRPNLNANFVYFSKANDAGGHNRIFVVPSNQSGNHFWCHMFVNMSALRMLPRYGIPSI